MLRAFIRMATIGAGMFAAVATAQPAPNSFEPRFMRFVEAIRRDPSAPPAFAIVVVHRDDILIERAFGARDLASGAPLTLDSPIYTASVTKSYIGLLAAQLDAAGLLPLTATLRDVWPHLTLATGQDPAAINARAFLSHVSGLESPAIQWRYSDSGEFAASDVPALLATHAVRANRAFDYGNFGPVIYTAMAEARLGRSWRDLLQEHVAHPLGLARTTARLEDLPVSELARCHARVGGAWRPVPPKPTALLDAGGGIYASARDAGRYLRAFTSDGRSASGAIPAAVLRRTYEPAAAQDRDFLGFHRTGYGLGWDLSDYRGHRLVSRSGGSAGCRSFMAFLPDRQFGVVMLTLGDAGANGFNVALIQQAIDYWVDDQAATERAAERLRAFAAAALAGLQQADAQPAVPEDRRNGASSDHVGWYRADGFGSVAVSLHPDGLEARAGVLRLLLVPKTTDLFEAQDATTPGAPWDARFTRDARGIVDALTLNGVRFRRE